MKYIVKQAEPQAFTDWKALANDDWQPIFKDLPGNTRKAVKDALMTEQGWICCYCERRITDDDSHIEHFRPQSDPVTDPLDFNNLLCSCQKRLEKGEPRHCGNLKGNWFDVNLLISPLDPGCEKRFAFMGDGVIKEASDDDQAASETITKFGLAIPKLNEMRAKVIEPFLDEDLSNDEMQIFVTGYLTKDTAGRFGEFWTTIHYLFGRFVVA
jgi:uncharacterized protein (TIGR02646 family)